MYFIMYLLNMISRKLSKEVWQKYGPNCKYCNKLLSYDNSIEKCIFSYIISINEASIDNLQITCKKCYEWNMIINDNTQLREIITNLQNKLIIERQKNNYLMSTILQ